MSSCEVDHPRHKRAPGRAAILAYLLRNAKLIGKDEAGRSVISLSVDDWLMDQLVTANSAAGRGHGAARSAPEATIVESARAA